MFFNSIKGCMLMLLAVSTLVSACSGPMNPTAIAKSNSPAIEKDVPVLSLGERQQAASKLNPAFIQAQNRFGLTLHQKLAPAVGQGQNLILSPYSIFTALALAYNGADGQTAKEMAQALGVQQLRKDQISAAFHTLQTLLEDAGSGVRLNTANSVWYQRGGSMKDSFVGTARKSYGAEIRDADFQNKKTLNEINDWVSKHTNGKIPSILDQLPAPETLAVLLNAVYFNGSWQKPFDPKDTREGSFTLADKTVKKVPMMAQSGMFEYKNTSEAQAIRLPYGDGRLDMMIIMPAEGRTLADLMNKIRKDPSPWQGNFPNASGEIRLPRFKAEYSGQLKDPLAQMGMKQAFDPAAADFTAMSDIKPLFISSVLHKTVVDVNEQGTEAAAVTAIGLATASAPLDRFRMDVDHPFFFCIEDRQTGLWIFMGTIENP
ncbi:serpin family protein [Paenibacillus donghaensis]|uniref:serpin family protein n=1 Tax=Paenibacillus donghaensis TaxID=414771 RepID=UPI0018835867|nr:serpin family protein [Paenibacillus donghaensis]MBE9916310.1 serpin family protein [Paenibacillus donghaensis]